MRFWDSSALLSLLAEQPGGPEVAPLLTQDPDTVLWWGTPVEMESGACRLRRTGLLSDHDLSLLLTNISEAVSQSEQIEPTEQVRTTALRVLRIHDLRAANALQLAAALVWTEHNPRGVGFVCLDRRLREAAEREGFTVLPS